MPSKRMSVREFRDFGYLHELNRGFLHPLGLALEVITDDKTGEERLGGVWDYQDDPEGLIFTEGTLDPEKVRRVAEERERRRPAREKALGYWQQPIPEDTTDE
jgi:hypothetical protein